MTIICTFGVNKVQARWVSNEPEYSDIQGHRLVGNLSAEIIPTEP